MSVTYYSVDKLWTIDYYHSFAREPRFRLIGSECFWLIPGTEDCQND
jgi:hypothetical protein